MVDDIGKLKQELATMLRTARENSNLTREKVAAALECDVSKIYRFEKGITRIVSKSELSALMRLYKLPSHKARRMEAYWLAIKEAKARKNRK